jgi:LPXTG-motif cell wall-anchored protein
LEILHPIDLPVNAVVVLIPATGINVAGEQLREMEPTQVQGITYQMFSTGRLEAGSELRLTLSGSPKSSAGLTSSTGSSLAIGLLAFGLVLVAGGVWLYRRRRGERGSEEAGELGSEGVDEVPAGWEQGSWGDAEDSNTLLDAILALDDKYQAGELPEEAYLQRRAELKARLKTLLGSLGAGELGRKGEG